MKLLNYLYDPPGDKWPLIDVKKIVLGFVLAPIAYPLWKLQCKRAAKKLAGSTP